MEALIKNLNPPQAEAVTTTDGPLLVIAGAGSGKTRVLTQRLAYILATRKAAPHELLAVTFTNKAANEMGERVGALLGALPNLWISTFHSLGLKLLRREHKTIGYSSSFQVFDTSSSQALLKDCVRRLGYPEGQFPPKAELRKISDIKTQLITPEAYASKANNYFESRRAELYTLYQRRLRSIGAMDFDDLICETVYLLRDHPDVASRWQQRFRYLMVDEYQDTNHVQYLMLRHLLNPDQNICVVGDEDQSIYAWRGADIRNILEFERDFPGARIIKLEQNYRSTGTILRAASAVIANNSQRKPKELWTNAGEGDRIDLILVDNAQEEAKEVVDRVQTAGAPSLRNQVILYRTNAQSRPFEEELRRRNIAYKVVGGTAFYDRAEIRDILAYLQLIANAADDVSFDRIIGTPNRGIGKTTVDEIHALAVDEENSYYGICANAGAYPSLAGKAKRIAAFVELIESYRAMVDTQPVDLMVEQLIKDLKYVDYWQNKEPHTAEARIENLEALVDGAAEFMTAHPDAHLPDYLSEIALYTDLDDLDKEKEERLSMMTIHSAKGLEYDTVYVVGLEQGLFPMQRQTDDPMNLEEERRLFYVAATRARQNLHLFSAAVRGRFADVETIPSQFIKEIPEALLDRLELRTRKVYSYDASSRPAQASLFGNGGRRAAQPAAASGRTYVYEEDEVLQPGRIVQHKTFGQGRIMTVDGFGDSLRIEVNFAGLGVKKLMARYANLKVIG